MRLPSLFSLSRTCCFLQTPNSTVHCLTRDAHASALLDSIVLDRLYPLWLLSIGKYAKRRNENESSRPVMSKALFTRPSKLSNRFDLTAVTDAHNTRDLNYCCCHKRFVAANTRLIFNIL